AVTDITERKRAEELLRGGEDRFRRMVDATPAMIHTARPEGRIQRMIETWLKYLGQPLHDLSGWGWTGIFDPHDLDQIIAQWRTGMATGEGASCEGRVRRADGAYRTMLHRKVPLRGPDGVIVKWYGSSTDIEDLKRALDEIQQLKDKL